MKAITNVRKTLFNGSFEVEMTSINCSFTVFEVLKRSKTQFLGLQNRQKRSKNAIFLRSISYTIGTFAQKGPKNEEMAF
jgi:hypothetical protein